MTTQSPTLYQRFQQASNPYDPATLAVSFLSWKDQANVAVADRSWRIAVDYRYAPLFKGAIREGGQLFLTDETHKREAIQLKSVLGRGGSKIAFDIGEGRALLLPQQKVNLPTWRRVVAEEVAMTEVLTSWGLLTPLSRPVLVSRLRTAWNVSAYISESFASLVKTKRWFIIDFKNSASSTWIRDEHFLFSRAEERFVEKNWDIVFEPLLADLTTYAKYNPPFDSDSRNLAIVKNVSQLSDTPSPYVVRFFGFDFSSRKYAREIPKKDDNSRPHLSENMIKSLLDHLINCVFWCEFCNAEESFDHRKLQTTLIEKYLKIILSRL